MTENVGRHVSADASETLILSAIAETTPPPEPRPAEPRPAVGRHASGRSATGRWRPPPVAADYQPDAPRSRPPAATEYQTARYEPAAARPPEPAAARPPEPGGYGSRNGHGPLAPHNGHDRAVREPMPAPQPAMPAPRPAAARRRPGGRQLRLVWVYPDLLSTYGDRGNLLVLTRRAQLRGLEVAAVEVNSDQRVPQDGDIYLLGGGEDLPQILAAARLRADGGLLGAAERGAVVFAVCAGYQLIGRQFGGVEGEPVTGLGILDVTSGRGERRGVGEIVADVDPALGVPRLTGFENHQGVTHIGPAARPLARVALGVGNGDGTEGAYAGGVLGTYLHGPALARNPGLADLLLSWAAGPLQPLPAGDEDWARRLREERLAATSS